MKRLLVVSMLSLALAGCAQSKGALSRGASYPPSPVALTPVPSIYDTVNQGMGGKAVAQTAIANPDDPHWAGRAPVSVAAGPVSPGPPGSAGGPHPTPAASAGAANAAPAVASGLPQPTGQPIRGIAGASRAGCPCGDAADRKPGPNVTGGVFGDARAGRSSNARPRHAGPGTPLPTLGRSRRDRLRPIREAFHWARRPSGPKPSAALPTDVAVSPPASSMPATLAGAPGPKNPAPKRNADPLLGPDPDLMPAMPELPAVRSSNKQAKPPAGTSLELVPALVPASGPTPELNPAEPPAHRPGSHADAGPGRSADRRWTVRRPRASPPMAGWPPRN